MGADEGPVALPGNITAQVAPLAVTPDSRLLASASGNAPDYGNMIKLCTLPEGRRLSTLEGHLAARFLCAWRTFE